GWITQGRRCLRKTDQRRRYPEQDPEDEWDLGEVECVECEHPDRAARNGSSECREEPVVTRPAGRAGRLGELANSSHEEPGPCSEADETDFESQAQPLVVEDRGVSVWCVEAGEPRPQ